MSRGPYPIMLLLAMSLPGAARAIGLGDIRVDSALNERLSAQIDIVGATRDELIALTAKVANREVFQRFGAERPSFLSSATFKVGLDANGRPVLNVRSSDSFTDPVVDFLVDLRWGKGELIREYSLLLDPAGFGPANASPGTRLAQAVPATGSAPPDTHSAVTPAATGTASAPAAARLAAPAPTGAPAADATASSYYRVVTGDTLRGIVRSVGARTETHAQRLMIAIFRGNPHAFDGNINRVHLGALLNLPTGTAVDAIDGVSAKREVRAQMTAWRLDRRPASAHLPVASPVANPVANSAATAATAATTAAPAATAAANEALQGRIQSLEHALDEVHRQLTNENSQIEALKRSTDSAAAQARPVVTMSATPAAVAIATPAAVPPATAVPEPAAARVAIVTAEPKPPVPVTATSASAPAQVMSTALVGSVAAALALLVGGFAYLRRRLSTNHAQAAGAHSQFPDDPARFTYGGEAVAAMTETPKRETPKEVPPLVVAGLRDLPTEQQPAAPAAIVAEEIHLRETQELDDTIGIDTVALERSYLDALGIDHLGIDTSTLEHPVMHSPDLAATQPTAVHDSSDLDTVAVDMSELDTAVIRSELNTMIIEPNHQRSDAGDAPALDYNLLDLNMTGQHVQMASDLKAHAVITERRTTIVEALQTAIDKDPNRRDLRLKLLETYYSTASLNQRAFIEAVKELARERESLSQEEWQRVLQMGREIAPTDPLFAGEAAQANLANCA